MLCHHASLNISTLQVLLCLARKHLEMGDTQPGTTHCSEKHHTCNPASPESRCRVDSTCVEGWATSTELLSGGHSHVTCSSSAVSTQQAFIAVSYLCKGLNGIPPSSVSLPLGNHLWCQTSSYMQFLGVLHMEWKVQSRIKQQIACEVTATVVLTDPKGACPYSCLHL